MVNRAYILLFVLCIQFDPSLQQRQTLRHRLDYVEVMINSVIVKNLKTQFDISKLRDAMELLNNKTEGESCAHAAVSSLDAAAIADLESEMKKTISQQELTITAIAKAVSDEKKYTRQQMKALEIVSESIAKQCNDEIKSDVMEMNNKVKDDVQEVKSDVMEMNSKLKTEVEKHKEEILELRQMILEMKQTKTVYSSAAVTVPAHLPSCPDGWLKFQDTCYLYVENDEVSWDVAKTRCFERGGILAEPDTEEKMRYLLDLGHTHTWLGGTDRLTEDTWVWSSSKRNITFFIWVTGQPNSYNGRDQDCLEIGVGGLNDFDCSFTQPYICEKKANVS